jgi:Tol biopolymer transport system component/tRNA A-37 threonylcarbamoyl transferase component Bud32
MLDPVQRALDSVADSADLDWVALVAELSDEQTLSTLHALREIAAIARAHDAPPLSVQRTLPFAWGPLEVRQYIARGAHGDVYRAWDPRLEREVALKLRRAEDVDEEQAPFAITEGRLLARVQHPNVVAVYGADRVNGQAGIWMELVEGSTVRDLVAQQGPLTAPAALQIGIAVCSGLAAVHAAGLVHRDVKAQNVVRDRDGRTILMDLSAGQDDSGRDDRLEGTPVYLAPEVLDGGRATVASDLYAAGVLLFFLVTGRYPLISTSLDDLRRRHHAGEGERLATNRALPRRFRAVVDRALARNPADRFHTADAMRAALASALSGRRYGVVTSVVAATTVIVISGGAAVFVLMRDGGGNLPSRAAGAAAAVVAQTVRPQRIRLPHFEMGVPSSDGATFAYVDEDGHLNVWEVATGRSRPLAEAHTTVGQGLSAAISPDGAEVAYGWRLPDDAYELRVLSSHGTAPRTLIARQTAYQPMPVEWSRDGRTLLCWLRQRNGTSDLVLMPVDGGSPQLLHSLPSRESIHASLSPDGRFVLLSAGFSADSSSGLLIIETTGSDPRVLMATAGHERLARWTPEGTHVLFLRDSPSVQTSRDAWLVPVTNGDLQGDPVLAAADLGAVTSIALTSGGAMYRVLSTVAAEVYTAPFDVSGDPALGAPTRLSPLALGHHVGPAWSPDGRWLAYFTTREATPGATAPRTLTIQDMVSGEARQLPVPLLFVGGYSPRWSPDGKHVIIWGRNEERQEAFGYFQIEVNTGNMTPIVTVGMNAPAVSQYSRDGRRFFYLHPQRGVMARILATGEEHVTIAPSPRSEPSAFALAPDDQSIALIARTETDGRQVTTLEVHPLTGRPRELVRTTAPEWLSLQAWTPDGQHLLFMRGRGSKPYTLWLISARGGEPTDMHFSLMPTANPISLDPDGRRIAYTERVMQHELWITPWPVPASSVGR